MIDKKHFLDNYSRNFIPYQGWIKENGERDELTFESKKEKSLVVIHKLSHGNWHTTYNLQGKNGKMLLPNGVRSITRLENGYYVIEDNNEDELINKYGSIPVNEYIESYQISSSDGVLLSREHFDKMCYFSNQAMLVRKKNKYNLLLLTGRLLLHEFVDCICSHYEDHIYYVDLGVLYSCTYQGDIQKCKVLSELPSNKKYSVSRFKVENNKIKGISLTDFIFTSSGIHPIYLLSDVHERRVSMNYIVNGKFLLFDKWYDIIEQYNLGPYAIKSLKASYIARATGEFIKEAAINMHIILSDEKYLVARQNDLFHIYNNNYGVIHSNFTSIMWSDRGIWGMNTLSSKSEKHYFKGQCDELIDFAHEILITQQTIALFEKKGVWYYIDNNGYLHECFRNYTFIE